MTEDTPDSFAPLSLGKISVPVDLAYLRPAQAFTGVQRLRDTAKRI